jgi:hypothetical protein
MAAKLKIEPEALKSLYRSPGSKKKQLVLCKNPQVIVLTQDHIGKIQKYLLL